MKKTISTVLVLSLLLSSLLSFTLPVYAEGDDVDAVTTASESDGTWTTTAATTTAAPVAAVGTVFYTVKADDVMWKIAKANALTLDALKALNPQIKNFNFIVVGQKIIVKAAPVAVVAPVAPVVVAPQVVTVYQGIGQKTNFRVRGTSYSFNIAMASANFDKDGKIINAYLDSYEIGQTDFAGWPGTTPTITAETATAGTSAWATKRERGDAYNMKSKATTKNEWFTQLDFYQEFFVGKTVAQIREWFNKSTDAAGKPLVSTSVKPEDIEKLGKLTDAEKAELVDVVSSATMSLSDSHGLFLESLEEAYANRVEVKVPVK